MGCVMTDHKKTSDSTQSVLDGFTLLWPCFACLFVGAVLAIALLASRIRDVERARIAIGWCRANHAAEYLPSVDFCVAGGQAIRLPSWLRRVDDPRVTERTDGQ